MALSVGITAKANASGAGTATTTGATTTPGSGIALVVTATQATNPTITDSKGNTWTLVSTSQEFSATPARIFYFKNEGGGTRGASHTFSAQGTDVTLLVVEILGNNPVVDVSAANLDSTTAFDSSGVTPTVADHMLVAGVGANQAVTSWTAGNSFTKQQEETNDALYWPAAIGTRIVTGGSGSYNSSWTCGTNPAQTGHVIAAWKESAPAAVFDQEGARFRNDDGSETTATWAAAQDANVTAPLATNLRLRALVNTTNDAAATAYTLRYQKNGAGGYVAVPVGASTSPTISYGEAGALAYSASGGTSVAPAYPGNITTNSALVLVVGQKPSSANGGTVTTPTGWTLRASRTGANDGNTGGYTTTLGVDTGNCNIFVYTKDSVTGSESGTLPVTVGTNNVCWAQIIRLQASATATWSWAADTGKDTSAGSVSIASSAGMDVAAGDYLIGGMVIPTDVSTPTQFSAEAFSQTGTTFGTAAEISEPDSTTGNDIGGFLFYNNAASGSGSGVVTMTATAGGTTTNVRGPGFILRARVSSVTNEVYIATSSNITAGGEATTAQLNAPSGKSTSDFVAGRMWDDENGTDTINITADDYTEVEWCLRAQSPAANGDYFDFRVYNGAAAFDTYAVTPRWTLGSGVTASTPPFQSQARRIAPLMFY